jgi:uncharacterized protein
MTNDFNSAILDEVAHRPWPRPAAPWLMTQTWHDLLFAHWPVDPVLLRAKVPESFDVDLFEDRAWIGVIPFHMTNVSPRGVPSLPWLSEFPELNVRTYVRVGDKAGVYFFSLDAGSALAVTAARTLLNLPYHRAEMTVERSGSGIIYHSARSDGSNAHFDAVYEPTGTPFQPSVGTLEYFLTERYCLYHRDHRGAPYRLNIHHAPWLLQQADARIGVNTMCESNGLPSPGISPVLHFAKRQDMVAWAPEDLA